MSENNINNFQALIEQKRIIKKMFSNMLIAAGAPDRKAVSDYRPVGIMWEDLLAQIKKEVGTGGGLIPGQDIEVCDITLTPSTPNELVGSPTVFNVVGAPSALPSTTLGPIKIVPGIVEFSRLSDQGPWFNSINENQSVANGPSDTEWNSVYVDPTLNGHGNILNLQDRIYSTDFWDANNNQIGQNIVGNQLVCRVISTQQYFLITVSSWDMGPFGVEGPFGGSAGSFQEVLVIPPCEITFSDGSKQTTAAGINTNTWNFPNAAFVDLNTTEPFGVLGDGNKPFKTVALADAASPLRVLLPGNYVGNTNMTSGTYLCMPGVIFPSGSRLRDAGVFGDIKVLGHAVFDQFSYGVETSAGSIVYVECLDFYNTRSVAFALLGGTIDIKARNIYCNTQNGGAYANAIRGGATVTIECDQYYVNHWGAAFGNNNSGGRSSVFNLNCPDVRMLNGGWAGNIAKSLVNDQSLSSWPNITNIDFKGGSLQNLHSVQTSSFGAFDSALLLYVNNTNPDNPPVHTFKNGTVYANAFFGLCHHRAVTVGKINLEALKIKSNTKALNLYLTSVAGNGNWVEHLFNDCMFEGSQPNIIGNSQKCTFMKCTEKVTGEASSIIDYNAGNPQQLPIVFFVNSISQLDVGSGEFIENAPVGATYGLINSPSTEVIGAGVTDTWGGGYAPIPTLEIPNII